MKVNQIIEQAKPKWNPGTNYGKEKPLVSVLLPTIGRSREEYLERAIMSVLKQTLRNIELIIVDDASNDDKKQLIERFMKEDGRISSIRHTNSVGLPAISFYEAYLKAQGDYIAFITDDNEWYLHAIEKTVEHMQKHELNACFGISHLEYEMEPDDYIDNQATEQCNMQELQLKNFIGNGSVVLNKTVIEKVGLFDPHLSLTKVYDWDLWRRIVREFVFEPSHIYFAKEHGARVSDSLENSVRYDTWTAEESMRIRRNEMLVPGRFGEYDIADTFGKRSSFFIKSTREYIKQYQTKGWFSQDDASVRKIYTDEAICHQCKHVIILTGCVSASVSLCFDRIFCQSQHVIKICKPDQAYKRELPFADAVIVIRDLMLDEVEIITRLGIPCYYFIDDNITELYRDFPKNEMIKKLAEQTTKENLAQFKGVITSTKMLENYYLDNKLHHNLLLLEPSIDIFNIRPYNAIGEHINMAFIGGNFRLGILENCVLPALKRIAEEIPVVLYCPQSEENNLADYSDENLTIRTIPYMDSIVKTLNVYGEKKISIQIHCGEMIDNNKYKTKNALLNAVQLGAVLAVSKIEPFIHFEGDDGCYVMTDNTEENWFQTIKRLISDETQRKQLYSKAYDFCTSRYAGAQVAKDLCEELNNIPHGELYDVYKRQKLLYLNDLMNDTDWEIEGFSGNIKTVHKPRTLEIDYMCYPGHIEQAKEYKVLCTAEPLSAIGIVFTGNKPCRGQVVLTVTYNKYVLAKSKLDMKKIVFEHWTYFHFNKFSGAGLKEINVKLEFIYNTPDGKLGVYEDIRNRNFGYKLFNKLKLKPKGKNLLYVDFRR